MKAKCRSILLLECGLERGKLYDSGGRAHPTCLANARIGRQSSIYVTTLLPFYRTLLHLQAENPARSRSSVQGYGHLLYLDILQELIVNKELDKTPLTMIPGLNNCDPLPNALNDPRCLVAQNAGKQPLRVFPRQRELVSVAERSVRDLDAHFSSLRGGHLDIYNLQGLASFISYGGWRGNKKDDTKSDSDFNQEVTYRFLLQMRC